MEDLASGTKKRVLPSWMTAQAVEKRKAPVHTPKRRRMAAVAMARPTRRTVYCMNETELVDVALGILIEDGKQEKAGELPSLLGADKPEGSPSPSPHTSSGSSSDEEEGEDDAPVPGLSPPNTAGGRRPEEEEKEEEEDVLKYVREIFFS
nr:cell cycle regulator of non-homologous end joining isoform X2 [Oryctolagus cuniculus]